MTDSIFTRDGDLYAPTPLASGPWSPDALHGGAPAALFAHVFEQLESPVPMDVVRLTVELLRPVPMAPLRLAASVNRAGYKVQNVEGALFAGDLLVARAVGLRIRTADVRVPEKFRAWAQPLAPEFSALMQPVKRYGGFLSAFEIRFAEGGFEVPGPATAWFRMRVPLLPGVANSGLVLAAAAADSGNGISSVATKEALVFINPDLSITLSRPVRGEWVALQAATHGGTEGYGFAESTLFDAEGRVGRSVQSLYFEERDLGASAAG